MAGKNSIWLLTMPLLFCLAAGCTGSAVGASCGDDSDCPTGHSCLYGTCMPATDGSDGPDAGDGWAGTDGVPDTDYPPCSGRDDCPQGLVCLNEICVDVLPYPGCTPGDGDDCPGDRFCSPEHGGCVPWPAHPEPMPRCEYIPPAGQFTPREEWVWRQPTDAPEWNQVMMTPVVVPLDPPAPGDTPTPPAVLFNSFRKDHGYSQDGVLRAVSGANGSPIFSVTSPQYYTHPVSGIAAADIDGDGRPEIVTGKSGGRDLICFEHDGTFKWATDTGRLNVGWGGPAIANLDGQGSPEIVIGAAVVSAEGRVLWAKIGSQGQQPGTGTAAPFSVPADVDGDGDMEIVTGDVLYDHEGDVVWQTGFGDGFVAVANFTGSDRPEIVVVSRGSVRLQSSVNGQIIWLAASDELNSLPQCDPDCGLLGPPTVADFDGDGKPEIGVAGADVYMVLEGETGAVVWSVATRDGSSNITGSAVFDFEGDRRAEVVYADEVSLKVFRGADGQVLYEQPHSSLTACEYPVIADVDGDHNAEIVIAQNELISDAPQKFHGIRVFGDAQDNWVDTRSIWNQHAYYVTNVEDDAAVPLLAERNWTVPGLNNFRQNVQGEGLFHAPDLTARLVGWNGGDCLGDGLVLWAEVSNRGQQAVAAGVAVSFYRGDPRSGATLLGTVRTHDALLPGQSEIVSFTWRDPPVLEQLEIWVVADDAGWNAAQNKPSGENSECREGNNLGSMGGIVCQPET